MAIWHAYFAILFEAFSEIIRMATAEFPISNSFPMYKSSVFSLTITKSTSSRNAFMFG